MPDERRLYGDDVVVSRVLDKIELAARMAVLSKYPNGIPHGSESLMEEFAQQLAKVNKDLGI